MPTPSSPNSQNKAKSQGKPALHFDVHWLSGQKKAPDPLPSRTEYQHLQTASNTQKSNPRWTVNLLASFLAIGLVGLVGYGLFQSGLLPWQEGKTPVVQNEKALTPEQQRQADETIEAILALQELASQSESNSQTQKR
jgi:hypothetical protein